VYGLGQGRNSMVITSKFQAIDDHMQVAKLFSSG